jgi:serine/threonine protein kinase/TPR repeat protein
MSTDPSVCSSCNTPLPEAAAFCYVCGTPTPTGTSAESGATVTRPSLQSPAALVDTRRRLEAALGPHFQVGDLVGRGGFAEVFAVRDLRLKRDLAAKVLSPELAVNQQMLQRFRHEAEAIATLRHPSIVPIYDIGESGGIAYIVMPLIKGDTLRKILDTEGPLPMAEARRILGDVAGALQVAHAAGLVHRDIKPENIMLEGPRRQVLVMDFGIAKALDPASTGMTSSGLIVGTPHYMSPEQASGDAVDGRSDQYSLAVLGYRMVTGEHPFEAETVRALLYKQVFENPPPARDKFPDVPQVLSDALHRGMAKDPKDRFATIDEFATAISVEDTSEYEARTAAAKAVLKKSTKATAKPPASTTQVRPAVRRKSRTGLLLGGAVVVLGSIAVVAISRLGSPGAAPADSSAVVPAAVPAPVAESQTTSEPESLTRTTDRTDNAARASAAERRTGTRSAAAAPAAPASCADAVGASTWTPAFDLCQAEANGGSPGAMVALASLYETGRGTPADPGTAAQWYRKAADAGSIEAAYHLGQMAEAGQGIERNLADAMTLYQQAARRGYAPALRSVARFYEDGVGVRRNESEAANWYRRAVAANDVPSFVRLGVLYTLGKGVSKNEEEAARLFTRAAQAGDAEGQYALALAYLAGRGVPSSDSLGVMWLQRAATQGHEPARQELAKRP